MNGRASRLVCIGLLGGIAAAELLAAGTIYDIAAGIAGAHDTFGFASLCRNLLGLPAPDFYSELRTADVRMHEAMDIPTSGNPDRDFALMMMAHHQGAIDMALVQLKYGRDKPLRRLAQSIVVEQGQEIAYMRLLIHTPPASVTAGNSVTAASERSHD